jgi:hypothetical protein
MGYRCKTCGEDHEGLPDLGADEPDPCLEIPEEERAGRVVLTPDTCIIDDRDYFIRGVILIPIKRSKERFGIGAWVSQSKEHFDEYVGAPDSAEYGPFFGWLSTRVRYFEEDTFLLKTMAHFRRGGKRPTIELEPTDHPLAVDQREGITLVKAREIVHFYTRRG